MNKKQFQKILCTWEDTEEHNKKLKEALFPNENLCENLQ